VLLAVAAFIAAVVGAMGKCPWWVSVILLCLIELLRALPLGK
jgi:ABC-type phosphate/phosphonate transport system permease subunit